MPGQTTGIFPYTQSVLLPSVEVIVTNRKIIGTHVDERLLKSSTADNSGVRDTENPFRTDDHRPKL